jgi:hypothetical protein
VRLVAKLSRELPGGHAPHLHSELGDARPHFGRAQPLSGKHCAEEGFAPVRPKTTAANADKKSLVPIFPPSNMIHCAPYSDALKMEAAPSSTQVPVSVLAVSG